MRYCMQSTWRSAWHPEALDLSVPSQDNKLETSVALKEKGHVLCGRQVLSILLIQKEKEKKKDVIQSL